MRLRKSSIDLVITYLALAAILYSSGDLAIAAQLVACSSALIAWLKDQG